MENLLGKYLQQLAEKKKINPHGTEIQKYTLWGQPSSHGIIHTGVNPKRGNQKTRVWKRAETQQGEAGSKRELSLGNSPGTSDMELSDVAGGFLQGDLTDYRVAASLWWSRL